MKPHQWKTTEDAFIRKYYPSCGSVFVADALGLKPQQVRDYAHRIGVKTRHRGGRPFESVDSRRGVGVRFRAAIRQ